MDIKVKGYENYTIDLDGNVWSKKRKKYLRPSSSTTGGYLKVVLSKNGKSKCLTVHRLMGLTYLPNFYNKQTIDHKDRNKTNNKLYNLKWATHKEQNFNKGIYTKNITKHRNICILKKSYNLVIVVNKKRIVNKLFSKNKWSLGDIIKKRNEYFKEFDIKVNLS